MIEIIPAILTDNLKTFENELAEVEKLKPDSVQIDFADGQFVDQKTLLPADLTASSLVQSSLVTEAHLMTENPDRYLSDIKQLNFKRVTAHLSTLNEPTDFIQNAKQINLKVGIAINPEVKLDELEPFISKLDYVVFMTVIPGAQGHRFEEQVLEKVHLEFLHSIRNKHGYVTIEIDGGVKLDNIKEVIEVGAERIVVGSGIWKAKDHSKAYQGFVDKANKLS